MLSDYVATTECGTPNPLSAFLNASVGNKPAMQLPKLTRTVSDITHLRPHTEFSPSNLKDYLHTYITSTARGVPFNAYLFFLNYYFYSTAMPITGLSKDQQVSFAKRCSQLCKHLNSTLHPNLLISLNVDPNVIQQDWNVGTSRQGYESAWSNVVSQQWCAEYSQKMVPENSQVWTNEFQRSAFDQAWNPSAPQAEPIGKPLPTRSEEIETTKRIQSIAWKLAPLANDPNMANTNFMKLMSAVANGRVGIENNQLVELKEPNVVYYPEDIESDMEEETIQVPDDGHDIFAATLEAAKRALEIANESR